MLVLGALLLLFILFIQIILYFVDMLIEKGIGMHLLKKTEKMRVYLFSNVFLCLCLL